MGPRKKNLRMGFTTGTAAAAAAKAAVLLLGGRNGLLEVDTPLPNGRRMRIPLARLEGSGEAAGAMVIKDAGDDPDVTHKAEIWCTASLEESLEPGQVAIEAGRGVGLVTRPGLAVAVGEPAINPAPRAQILKAAAEAMEETGLCSGIRVRIEVPRGEAMARKTLNPRLGILGGISILGTRGTVIPFSHEAYRETIVLSMDVAKARGIRVLGLSTGGRSERLLRNHLPDLPQEAFVQMGDYFGFSLEQAAKRSFQHLVISCLFGKLVKMARGLPCTHAGKAAQRLEMLADWCRQEGLKEGRARSVAGANTAREALQIIMESKGWKEMLDSVVDRALHAARRFAGLGPSITFCLFSAHGALLTERMDPSGGQ